MNSKVLNDHRLISIQDILAVWLDNDTDKNDDDRQITTTQLQSVVSDIRTFTDNDQCIEFILSVVDMKVCMIISELCAKYIVPCVHDISQVDSIFILSPNNSPNERWLKEWSKIKNIFTDIEDICDTLKQTVYRCEHNSISMSFMTSNKKLDQLDPSFMYTQIIKEILLTIEFKEQHVKEFVDYYCETFVENKIEWNRVKQLEREYYHKTPIWWYTTETYLYSMLNRGLRLMQGNIIKRMGFFINDLHRHIEALHKKQYLGYSSASTFTIYRGQGLSKKDFDQLLATKNGLMSFNNFLSASKDHDVSFLFAESNASNPDLIGILFVMKIDPAQSTSPFASIHEVSHFGEENEILFSMHTVFRIHDIKQIDEYSRLYEVHLSLTSDSDEDLRVLTDHIRENVFLHAGGWTRFGLILSDMHQLDTAEEIYNFLLMQPMSKIKEAAMYNALGSIKYQQGEYQQALALFEKSSVISQKTLSLSHPYLAIPYQNIGAVYYTVGDYPKALSYYEKALAIRQQSSPVNHPDLAKSYEIIGLIYNTMGAYSRALTYYEETIALLQQSLPANHPNLAKSLDAIGSVYFSIGDYSRALSYYERTIVILQHSLPDGHPDLATSFNNIGLVYSSICDYSRALLFHEKALTIRQKSLPANHCDLAGSYSNIGLVYASLHDYPKALSSFEKALEIQEHSLPKNHLDLAISYNNIGLVYLSMNDLRKAFFFQETALEIRQQALPANHPDLATSYNNIGVLYKSTCDYSKALSFHEKALSVLKQSVPSNHPDFVGTYSNIGLVYECMGSYAKAYSLYERAVDIGQQSLVSDHAHLQSSKERLKRVKKKL